MKRTFVDRIEELRHLHRALKYDGKEIPVLVFTGIGGMGKTALRIAFEQEILKPNKIPYAVLDYDGDPNLRPIEATLRTIRRQIGRHKVKTPVFDFLYARYFELSTGLKISAKNFPMELEGVVNILEAIPGVSNVTKVLHGLSQLGLVAKERLQHKDWLYRIRDLEPREVMNLLPEVLAEDLEEAMTIQNAKTSGFRIPLLLDAYETLSDSQIDDALHRKLLLLTPHLLRVIFTRAPLPWEHTFPKEWQGKIKHIPSLDNLSQEDATTLLRKKHVDNPLLHKHLYQLTGGYPLHLELCVDICREIEETTNRKPEIHDFEGAVQVKNLTEDLVQRLLRQLTDNERDLMGLAVYPRWVSEEVLEVLSSVPESVPRIFKKFTGLSMFSPHPDIPDAYVIRREVRDCLRLRQNKERLFKQRHGKLSQFHRGRWEETQSFHYLQEALYHRFYEDPDHAIEMFEEHFWKLREKFWLGEAEGLLESIPIDILSEKQKRKVDYARARLLTCSSRSQHSLISAMHLYETLVASETDEESLGKYLFYLGFDLHLLNQYERALEYYKKSLAIRLRVFGEQHPDVAESYTGVGEVYSIKGEYEKALEYYKKGLAITLKLYGEEHPDVAASYNNIGNVYSNKGEYEKALEYLEKSLAIGLKVYGEEHPRTARSYSLIGHVYWKEGEYDNALEYFKKSLAINLKLFGEESPGVARFYIHLGNVYYDKSEYDKALEHYQKSLAMFLKIFGEEHPHVAISYNNISLILREKGEYEKALDNYERSLAILLKIFGEQHPDVANSYNNIGVVYRDKGEYKKALQYHHKAIAILLKIFGEEHPWIAESYDGIARTLWALKKHDEAFENMHKSVDTYRKSKHWKDAIENIETLAKWLDEKGKKKEAEEKRAEAQKIRKDHDLP
ncbi:tetratricopeptide repeat protein [bacterium]|nr:tetratricopeptide repeat protein [bacterium]